MLELDFTTAVWRRYGIEASFSSRELSDSRRETRSWQYTICTILSTATEL